MIPLFEFADYTNESLSITNFTKAFEQNIIAKIGNPTNFSFTDSLINIGNGQNGNFDGLSVIIPPNYNYIWIKFLYG